jgi:hypothetical protein
MAQRKILDVKEGLDLISNFIKANNITTLWGNGATFDNVILRNLYARHLKVFPLGFWTDRDLRTAVDIYNIDVGAVPFVGIRHYCLDDARHQVKILTDKSLRK